MNTTETVTDIYPYLGIITVIQFIRKVILSKIQKVCVLINFLIWTFPNMGQSHQWLGQQTEWINSDLDKKLSLIEIARSHNDQIHWKKSNSDVLSFGLKANHIWTRTPITNSEDFEKDVHIELMWGNFKKVNLYIVNNDGQVTDKVSGGTSSKIGKYGFNSPYPLISTKLKPYETKILLLEIEHHGAINVPLRMFQSDETMTLSVLNETTIGCFYYASIGIMIAFSLIFYITTKNTIFLLFSMSILFHRALPQSTLDGFFFKYVTSQFTYLTG